MLNLKQVKFDQLLTNIYDFEFAGDILAPHTHFAEDDSVHITICCKGKVQIDTPTYSKVLESGNIIEFFNGQQHSIKALEDNSRVINIPKQYNPHVKSLDDSR